MQEYYSAAKERARNTERRVVELLRKYPQLSRDPAVTDLLKQVRADTKHDLSIIRKLEGEALVDRLTGLWNRNAYDADIASEIDRTIRHKGRFSVIMVDGDGVKKVNDTEGHPAGNVYIQEMAERIRKPLRLSERVHRYGGDEFTILVSDASDKEVGNIIHRTRESLDESRPTYGGKLSASFGYASFEKLEDVSYEEIYHAFLDLKDMKGLKRELKGVAKAKSLPGAIKRKLAKLKPYGSMADYNKALASIRVLRDLSLNGTYQAVGTAVTKRADAEMYKEKGLKKQLAEVQAGRHPSGGSGGI